MDQRGDEIRAIAGIDPVSLESEASGGGSVRDGTKDTDELAGRVHRTGHAGVNSGIGAVAASHGIPGRRAAIALRAVVLSADKHDVLIGEMNAMRSEERGVGKEGSD